MASPGQVQPLGDFRAGALIRRGGQGNARHIGEFPVQQGQLQVIVAEVMAPLGDAVSFVDGKQGNLCLVQQRQGTRLYQPFRGDVQHVQLALEQGVFQGPLLLHVQGGIEKAGFDAQCLERIHLVLHQRDQRADHHPDAGAHQCRNLVAQGFAAASGHQHQSIVALD